MSYNTSGKLKLTIVNGLSYTGLYAADGTYNAVQTAENTTIKGVYHPCGALWSTTVAGPTKAHSIDGSRHNVSDGGGGFVLAFP